MPESPSRYTAVWLIATAAGTLGFAAPLAAAIREWVVAGVALLLGGAALAIGVWYWRRGIG